MDYRKAAREIVERALLATVRDFNQEAFANWERALLGDLLNASQLPGFLDRLVRGLSERGADSNRLQFFHQLGSIPSLLRSPSSVVVDFAEVFLEPFDFRFQKMMRGEVVKPPWLPPELEEGMSKKGLIISPGLPPTSAPPPPAPTASERWLPWRKHSTSIADATLVQVFYATDRMQVPQLTGGVRYAKQRSLNGKVHYGRCEVSIPKIHKIGKLETPSILRLEFRPNPDKHIILSKTSSLGEDRFFDLLKSSVAKSVSKDAFVFVHGYNVSFEGAARRTGQIAYDLDFVGAPIFYSWPSNGKMTDYLKDETNINWSTPHFQHFLGLLAEKSGAERVHIIAHSMGNRAVCDALKAISYGQTNQLWFNHLVLAAPDIDADTFQELAATLQRLAGRVTLYESSKDKAIQASKKIHGNPRAGEPLLVVRGMDTIDASVIDTDFLGHSYFSDNWPLLSDIHSILFKDEPPSGRFGLVEMDHEDGKYYAFRR
jgi:esterase/lipase superfamily enzyme